MYKNNFNGRSRRSVYKSSPSTTRRPRGNKQYIDPARFIKKASPVSANDYTSTNSFADFAIHPLLKSNVATKGYTTPSEIQDKTINIGLSGKDVVGVANTGTGKTAAFALPILNRLMREPQSQAIIIAPTRELALQIEEQCKHFAKNSGLNGAVLIGGMPMGRQLNELKQHPRIIIGTPGRIKDHLQQGTLKLSGCNMVVLDEVDRMLDMGFINDIRFLLDQLPKDHQAFFFSATLKPEIRNLIHTFTRDPEIINVKVGETTDNVDQNVVRYTGNIQRMDLLHELLINEAVQKTLIFGETKYGVERLSKELVTRGFKSDALHGGKSQGQRKRALDKFHKDQINILVATDVAARGIDVKDITHVINYDTPQTYEDYIHRVGRAGRAGNTGYALTFVEKTS
jgi:ATP-dependent RNA helicase RhlE